MDMRKILVSKAHALSGILVHEIGQNMATRTSVQFWLAGSNNQEYLKDVLDNYIVSFKCSTFDKVMWAMLNMIFCPIGELDYYYKLFDEWIDEILSNY